jgi:hypothetical protein
MKYRKANRYLTKAELHLQQFGKYESAHPVAETARGFVFAVLLFGGAYLTWCALP